MRNHKLMINAKSKRRRNLVKKCIELSQMCNVETLLVVRDCNTKRVTVYESGPEQARFTLQDAYDHVRNMLNNELSGWSSIRYTDENYGEQEIFEENCKLTPTEINQSATNL